MSYLTFINDDDFKKHVKTVLNVAKNATDKAEEKLYKNTVDPFSALFDASHRGISLEEWLIGEKERQIQKTLQNAIGDFHEDILGSMRGCEKLAVGKVVDFKCEDKKIIAEIKNKHNTTKGNHKIEIYDALESRLKMEEFNGYTTYFVEVIPKGRNRYDKVFTPPDSKTKERRPENEKIRVIDGYTFYAMISGIEDALKQLYEKLPKVIEDVLEKDISQITGDKYFSELFDKAY